MTAVLENARVQILDGSSFIRLSNVRYRKMKNRPNFLQSVARHTVILVMNLETNFPSPLVNAGMGKINHLKNTEH